ncbi:E3 ubiquitin-protein ligase RNF128 isoform 1-T1 [Discoglossus pictus]
MYRRKMRFGMGVAHGSLPCMLFYLLLLGAKDTRADTLWTANVNYSYVMENRTWTEEGEIGLYGQDSPLERASGLVVLPRRDREYGYTACKPNVNFSIPPGWTDPWIALIQRGGGCTFTDKINAAANRGARAVVIFNNLGSETNDVIKMSHSGTKDTVALMIGNLHGLEIVQLINNGIQVTMVIEVGKQHGTWVSHYSIFFVSVSFFIVTAATVGYFIFYSARRWRATRAQNKKLKKLKAEAKKAINQLQIRTIKQGDKELDPDADSCAVCIDSYKPNDVVRILTCNHFFHKNCIDPWLLEHRTCPMCKCDILKTLGVAPNDEEEGDTNLAIPSVSSELQRSTIQIEEDNHSDNASSGYASVREVEEPSEDGQHTYESVDLVKNDVAAMAVDVLPHMDNPAFESDEARIQEMKS